MKDQAADWLAFTVLALFCGTVLYGGVVIQALLN
jgi:hypothetical protein